MADDRDHQLAGTRPQSRPDLPPAARRALEEAEQRRKARDDEKPKREKEIGGRDGPDPARYGDWEKDGIISDF